MSSQSMFSQKSELPVLLLYNTIPLAECANTKHLSVGHGLGFVSLYKAYRHKLA